MGARAVLYCMLLYGCMKNRARKGRCSCLGSPDEKRHSNPNSNIFDLNNYYKSKVIFLQNCLALDRKALFLN